MKRIYGIIISGKHNLEMDLEKKNEEEYIKYPRSNKDIHHIISKQIRDSHKNGDICIFNILEITNRESNTYKVEYLYRGNIVNKIASKHEIRSIENIIIEVDPDHQISLKEYVV